MTTKILVLPDTQVPYQDKRFVASLLVFAKAWRPDEVVHVGDLLDSPEPSRWNKGSAGEYALTLQASIKQATEFLESVTKATPRATRRLRMGNHDERIETYVSRYAPALRGLEALRYEALLDTDRIGWSVERDMFDVAPGWVCAHGHEGSLSRNAGYTALNLARQIGKSVVCGHTHRAGLVSHSVGYNGRINNVLYGMEVGHSMSLRDAHYLKTGAANWQQAFGMLEVDGTRVHPTLVFAQGGKFCVNGKLYG